MAVYLILVGVMIWAVWPLVLLGACAVCGAALTAVRPWLGLLPPAVAGALAALAQRQADAAWDMRFLSGLFWLVFRRYAICAFVGSAVGLAAGLLLWPARRWVCRRLGARVL